VFGDGAEHNTRGSNGNLEHFFITQIFLALVGLGGIRPDWVGLRPDQGQMDKTKGLRLKAET
jgi:hypothetical protein